MIKNCNLIYFLIIFGMADVEDVLLQKLDGRLQCWCAAENVRLIVDVTKYIEFTKLCIRVSLPCVTVRFTEKSDNSLDI